MLFRSIGGGLQVTVARQLKLERHHTGRRDRSGQDGAQIARSGLGIRWRNGMVTEIGGGHSDADGGPVRHVPVLLNEVLEALVTVRPHHH